MIQYVSSYEAASTDPAAEMEEMGQQPLQLFSRSKSSGLLSKLGLLPSEWGKRQLVGVMVENHEDARPHHAGLEKAVIIEEWMVEGLISRFIAVFDIGDLPKRVGPVRSLRPYFIDGTKAWTNTYIHAGGSPEALEKFDAPTTLTSMNGLSGKYHDEFVRDPDLYAPHDLFAPATMIRKHVQEDPEQLVEWPPYEYGRAQSASGATQVTVNFYNNLHNISYTFLPHSQQYERENGGTIATTTPSNVLILEVPILGEGEYGRLTIPVQGSGNAVLFRSGKVYTGHWSADAESGFSFTDTQGNPLVFARGQTWMTVLPTLQRLNWSE